MSWLPDGISIFTAEAYALLIAMNQGLNQNKDFIILTDSYSCLSIIQSFSEHPIIVKKSIQVNPKFVQGLSNLGASYIELGKEQLYPICTNSL